MVRCRQVYFIDGQALGPENFGFTDPLTNTWRPKKYNVSNDADNGALDVSNATVNNAFDLSSYINFQIIISIEWTQMVVVDDF